MLGIILKKKCSKCGKLFPATNKYFYKDKTRKFGLGSWCTICRKQYCKTYNKKYKKRVKNSRLKSLYGITLEYYEKILKSQDYCCAICGKTVKENKKFLAVDHDHKFQKEYKETLIRGLLCTRCNRYVMGMMRDDKKIFKGTICYLIKALKEYNRRIK